MEPPQSTTVVPYDRAAAQRVRALIKKLGLTVAQAQREAMCLDMCAGVCVGTCADMPIPGSLAVPSRRLYSYGLYRYGL